jgi:hypothetical protein
MISSLFVVAELLWSIQLALRPDPFTAGSATLIVAGIAVYTVITVVGILLVRALWARWLALATTIVTLTLGSLGRFDHVLPYAAAAVSLLAVGGLTGPWLRVRLRQHPEVGVPPQALLLPLVATLALPLAGIASPDGPTLPCLVVAFCGPVLSVAYVRAAPWGLWALRTGLPILAVVAGISTGWWGAAAFIAYGSAVAVLSWSSEARDAMTPVLAPLPPPRAAPHTGGIS